MIRQSPASILAISLIGMFTLLSAWPCHAAAQNTKSDLKIDFTPEGQVILENQLIKIRLSDKTGPDQGITSWLFKPDQNQAIDVLYGQTDYLKGHAFGEKWDPVNIEGYAPATPRPGSVLPPSNISQSKDGSVMSITQTASDTSELSRQVIMRRDLAAVQIHFKLTNLSAPSYAVAMRLHTTWSPAAIEGRQNLDETIMLPTEQGTLSLDQSITVETYLDRYKGAKFFGSNWDNEPGRSWVNGKQPTAKLTGNWAVQVGTDSGRGMVMILAPKSLVGYYNALAATLEPVLCATSLRPGESWEAQGYMASFSGLPKGQTIVNATPLYVATTAIKYEKDSITGQIIPLFQGNLRVVDDKGKTIADLHAAPTKLLTLNVKTNVKNWQLQAIDTHGKRIGVINSDGSVALDETSLVDHTPQPPAIKPLADKIATGQGMDAAINAFLKDRDMVVYCDFLASDALKEQAREIARKLGVGIIQTSPNTKAIILGDPAQSMVVKQAGQFKHAITTKWPGQGKGVILAYDNLESTQKPALLVVGSDVNASVAAAKVFQSTYLTNIEAPKGFALWSTTPAQQIQPYTPAGINKPVPIKLNVARGEYEPAQIVLSAYDDLKDIDATLAPLVNAKTGKPMSNKYITRYRKVRGPLWLRWLRYYPLDPAGGWTGHPDPLMDYPIKDLASGKSQAMWLTVIVPETAEAGLYHTSLTLTANGQSKTIPIEVNVWDFTIPRTGLRGEPYMSFSSFPPDAKRDLMPYHLQRLTENLVEHGMRILSLEGPDLVRWHFDPAGSFKGKDTPWLTVSDDGKVALDTSGIDKQIQIIDAAAKPFEVSYRMSINSLVGWPYDLSDFRRVLPDRFASLPERKGHLYQSYYAQEMISLMRKHLVEAKLLDRYVLKIGDEPRSFQWWWDNLTVGAREADMPFVTALNSVSWPEVEQALGSSMKWIQPLYMHYNKEFYEKARKAGMTLSWYNCGPPPRNSAGTSAMELRSYIWQAAKADLDTIAWWGVQNWNHHGHHDIWYNRYSHWNSMLYPDHPDIKPWRSGPMLHDVAPIDSLRWEHIRDGMEDAAYVKLLRELIANARKQNRNAAADQAEKVLENIWKTVYPTHADYRPAYDQLMHAREQVANAIIDLEHQAALASSQKP